ncbi:MAG: class I SAM-dependent methyltransferase [Candidatus Omnitrophota bacterium]
MDNQNWKLVNCNLCGASDYKKIFTDKTICDGKLVLFDTVKCRKCGFIFNNPLNIKGAGYSFEDIQDIFKQAQWEINHKKDIYFYALNLLEKIDNSQGRALLDIGCACGAFLDIARLFGFKTKGIELSKGQAEYAQKQLNLDVLLSATVEPLLAEHKGFFNVVTMWDVLEHIPDPKSALNSIHNLLSDDGILMLKIPNSYFQISKARLARLLFPRMNKVLGAGDHVVHFTKKSIQQILKATDYEVIKLENSQWDRSLYSPFSVFQKTYYDLAFLIEKIFKIQIGNYYFVMAKKISKQQSNKAEKRN